MTIVMTPSITDDLIVRRVKVDRARTPRAVLAAIGRKLYVSDVVVGAMPRGEGDEAEVVFFKIDRLVSDVKLDIEYETRNLMAADPYSVAAVNEADPVFAGKHPNATH